jgi:hypothetical protein
MLTLGLEQAVELTVDCIFNYTSIEPWFAEDVQDQIGLLR